MRVGIIGWRGMVGSVLVQRMRDEGDFSTIDPTFFSTSQAGRTAPSIGRTLPTVKDASDLNELAAMDALVSCQGSEYTAEIHPALRRSGWTGYWIDAARTLRLSDSSVIVLDPVNRPVIDRAIDAGLKDLVGGNCTVSLMLMAMDGLFRADLIEWITAMTYQAASGAGAKQMRELVAQMGVAHQAAADLLADPHSSILDIDRRLIEAQRGRFPVDHLEHPLAGSLLPWIDADLGNGQSREESKAGAEGNKILGRSHRPVPIEGICVRVGSMRCHSQALTVKLRRDVALEEIETLLEEANAWVKVIPNEKEATLRELTPTAVSGTLGVSVGRLRKLSIGGQYLQVFTVGDQLLWGAAEPLRRALRIIAGTLDQVHAQGLTTAVHG